MFLSNVPLPAPTDLVSGLEYAIYYLFEQLIYGFASLINSIENLGTYVGDLLFDLVNSIEELVQFINSLGESIGILFTSFGLLPSLFFPFLVITFIGMIFVRLLGGGS